MAAVTMQRVPFGEVGSTRLQALQSAKNKQNAITEALKATAEQQLDKIKSSKDFTFSLAAPTKRSAAIFEEDNSDSENIDPAAFFSPKKAKSDGIEKPSLFNLDVVMSDTAVVPCSTPAKRLQKARPVSVPSTAPLKHKRVGALAAGRSSLSPYRRVDPPNHSARKAAPAVNVPFSIDAALHGTLAGLVTPTKPAVQRRQKRCRKHEVFEIHEDSPEMEKVNVEAWEQACAITADLELITPSSPSGKYDENGENKENVAPLEIMGACLSLEAPRPRSRSRSPEATVLEELAPERFFGEGLTRDSVAVVDDDAASEVETVVDFSIAEDE